MLCVYDSLTDISAVLNECYTALFAVMVLDDIFTLLAYDFSVQNRQFSFIYIH